RLRAAQARARDRPETQEQDGPHAETKIKQVHNQRKEIMGNRCLKAVAGFAALGVALAGQALAQNKAEKRNMELVGYHDLQGRSAYQPVIHKQGSRWIAYVGHHGDNVLNPLTGKKEDNGIAYLVSGIEGWRVRRMTQVYDLSDPAKPVFIRNFGLPGQQAGSPGEAPADLHGPISTGPKGNRIYFGYSTNKDGVLQIVDR